MFCPRLIVFALVERSYVLIERWYVLTETKSVQAVTLTDCFDRIQGLE